MPTYVQVCGRRFGQRAVEKARARWEKQSADSRRVRLSFDRLLELFCDDCTSFTTIAGQAGVTSEAIRKAYDRHFRALFPGKPSGRERHARCVASRRGREEKEFFDRPILGDIAGWLTLKGFVVERVRTRRGTISSSYLVLNDKRYLVRACHSKVTPGGKASYGAFTLKASTLKECHGVVLFQAVPGYKRRLFLLPVSGLCKVYDDLSKWTTRGQILYTPLILESAESPTEDLSDRPPATSSLLTWAQYEEPWPERPLPRGGAR